jgi:hypothetical protein
LSFYNFKLEYIRRSAILILRLTASSYSSAEVQVFMVASSQSVCQRRGDAQKWARAGLSAVDYTASR